MNAEHIKTLGDAVSLGTVTGALIGYLPAAAAFLTIVWVGLRIYETLTRRNHCANAVPGCPAICAPTCRHYRSKN